MATILESFDIDSPQHGKTFKIDLAEGLDTSHLDFMETQWAPAIQAPIRSRNPAILSAARGGSDTGEVARNLGEARRPGPSLGVAHEMLDRARHEPPCLLAAKCAAKWRRRWCCSSTRPRATRAAPLPIVYVDFVAVAPWNRKTIQHPQRFRHLGTLMLGAAVELSRTLGLDGRMWPSLPASIRRVLPSHWHARLRTRCGVLITAVTSSSTHQPHGLFGSR